MADGSVLNARSNSAFTGGNINVQANTVELADGGQLLTTAFSSGDAGTIRINATDRVTISGRDPVFAERVAQFGEDNLSNDGSSSGIFVRSRQVAEEAGDAGEIQINTSELLLENGGTLTAASSSVTGGNITLKISDSIILRNESSISASAGTAQAGGNGGNITLDTNVLAAVENSDITANAFAGDGGNVNLTTRGIFGIEFRDRLTPRSDITVSSELGRQGEVRLNTEIDPARGLIELSQTIVDPAALIAQYPCKQRGTSKFVITGRGGIPRTPDQIFNGSFPQVDLIEPLSSPSRQTPSNETSTPRKDQPVSSLDIVPARGWIRDENGDIILVGYDPHQNPSFRQVHPLSQCQL